MRHRRARMATASSAKLRDRVYDLSFVRWVLSLLFNMHAAQRPGWLGRGRREPIHLDGIGRAALSTISLDKMLELKIIFCEMLFGCTCFLISIRGICSSPIECDVRLCFYASGMSVSQHGEDSLHLCYDIVNVFGTQTPNG